MQNFTMHLTYLVHHNIPVAICGLFRVLQWNITIHHGNLLPCQHNQVLKSFPLKKTIPE